MSTRIAARRSETRAEILTAARRLARRDGIAGLSLRDLAAEIGMQAPSLYTYFDSKSAIYDALFAAGYEELGARTDEALAALSPGASRTDMLISAVETFLDFCTEDPARYQLLFMHAIPGWHPSEEAYAASVASYERMVAQLHELGITEPEHVDLLTALISGLASQQLANDPSGTRWRDLVPQAVEMFLGTVDRKEQG